MKYLRVLIVEAEEVEGGYNLNKTKVPTEGFIDKETFERFYTNQIENVEKIELVQTYEEGD